MTLPFQLAMPHPVLADISPGGAIYTLILIAWVISRLAGLRKQRRGAPREDAGEELPRPPASAPRPVDAELRELFETITGQKLEPVRPPPPPGPVTSEATTTPARTHVPPPLPPPVRPAPAPRPQRRPQPALARQAPPAPTPARRPPPPPAPRVEPRDESSDSAEQAEAFIAAGRGTSVAVAAPALTFGHHSAGGHALTIKLPSVRIGLGNATSGQSAHMLAALRTPQGLRTAMVQRVVLGPPRALDPVA